MEKKKIKVSGEREIKEKGGKRKRKIISFYGDR